MSTPAGADVYVRAIQSWRKHILRGDRKIMICSRTFTQYNSVIMFAESVMNKFGKENDTIV